MMRSTYEEQHAGPQSGTGGRVLASGFVLGVAFSGFFDGILLHQILQWHHLLSLVPGPTFQDPRVQIAADGGFHIVMYLLAAVGLVLLWKDARWTRPGSPFWRSFAIGFGAWNVADIAVFHWILEWHHVRIDTEVPLLWDVGWLLVFGVVPLLAAIRGTSGGRMGRSTLAAVTLAILASGVWAARAPEDVATLVLFAPHMTSAEVMGAVAPSMAA